MFDDAVRREFCRPPDQTLLALARDDRVGGLFVADAWRSYAISGLRRRPIRLLDSVSIERRQAVRIRPHRWRRRDSTDPKVVSRAYRQYGESIGKALATSRGETSAPAHSAALVTYDPFVAAYADSAWIARLVYFGQDDWATGEGVRPWWGAYLDAYTRIEERGADIFVVSQELADRISPRAVVVPNGVSPELWCPRHPAPARIDSLPRPRAIYTGTIDGRLERELVERTAAAVGSLIMIGHFGDDAVIRWLRSIQNVHLFGTVGQLELAATVQAADLGVIPHRDQAGIRAMSPLKLYEYLAAGLPVLAVDLPPLRGVADDRVHLCPPEDWVSGLTETLAMARAPEEARLQFIDSVAWSRRMQPVVDAAVTPGR
jgi:glycosyltransferase involved in cell wall biosynthesis